MVESTLHRVNRERNDTERAFEQRAAAKEAAKAEQDRHDAAPAKLFDHDGVSRYIPRPKDNIDKWDKEHDM